MWVMKLTASDLNSNQRMHKLNIVVLSTTHAPCHENLFEVETML